MRIETKEKTTERDLVDGFVIISTLKSAEAEFINYRDEAVECKVEYDLQGHLLLSQPNFEDKVEQSGRRYQDIKPTTKYVWKFEIAAQQRTKVNFNYLWKERQMENSTKQTKGRVKKRY